MKNKRRSSPGFNEGDRIAIIGMSGKYPDAGDLDTYWDNLCQGKNSIREIPGDRWDVNRYYDPRPNQKGKIYCKWLGVVDDVDHFDPLFFNIAPGEAELIDPQQRLFLQEGYKAFEHAGYSGKVLGEKKCGVYLGIMSNEYGVMINQSQSELVDTTGNNYAIASARLPYFLNLKGPAISIDTACSSSLVATHLACRALVHKEIDMALVGGTTLYLTPETYIGMCAAGMLSPDGQCKTFDNSADGFVPGEGVGALVLKRLEDAEADNDTIYGVIIGSGINQDGKTNGITAPSVNSQIALEREIYDTYGINPETISYVEMHGTGTKLGDPIELEALSTAFKEKTSAVNYCAVGSVKSNIGHTSAAAGVASVQKVLFCLNHKQLVPTLHYTEPNEHFDFTDSPFYVNTELKAWEHDPDLPRRACVSSFGFSGTNAHLVIEEYHGTIHDSNKLRPGITGNDEVFVFSARTEEQLRTIAQNMKHFGERNQDVALKDAAYTLQVGRDEMKHRLAFCADSWETVLHTLQAYIDGTAGANVLVGNCAGHMKKQQKVMFKEKVETLLQNTLGKEAFIEIAKLWSEGADIDWPVLHGDIKPQKIALPTYPFARERYWLPEMECSEPANGGDIIESFLRDISHDTLDTMGEHAGSIGTYLYEPCFLEEAVDGELPDVTYGEHVVFFCEPDAVFIEQNQTRLIQETGINRLIVLQSVHESLELRYEEYAGLIFCEIKRILEITPRQPVLIQVIVSDHDEKQVFAGLSGLLKTARLENPKIIGQVIEIERAVPVDRISMIIKDNSRYPHDSRVRYYADTRAVAGWNFIETGTDGADMPWKDNGVYLITGGAGGLGLIFAREIARQTAHATVILTGRSRLDAEKSASIRALEINGARFIYKQVDVSDAQALHRLISDITVQFGDLCGIIHSAGVIRDNFIIKKSSEQFLEVLSPKVAGVVNLDQATRGLSLDFFILFSSVAGVMGNVGQADYAAANAFMDAYALYRNTLVDAGRCSGWTMSINWPLWKDGGMNIDAETERLLLVNTGTIPMETGAGIAGFYQSVAAGLDRIVVLQGNQEKITGYLLQSLNETNHDARINEDTAVDMQMLRSMTLYKLKELFSQFCKIDMKILDPDEFLEAFGINSIIINQLNQKLADVFSDLSKTLFYEYQTLGALANHFSDEYTAECMKWTGLLPEAQKVPKTRPTLSSVDNQPIDRAVRNMDDIAYSNNTAGKIGSDYREPMAIIGMSGRYPQADTIQEFWENLKSGKNCITEIPEDRWSMDGFYMSDRRQAIVQGKSYSKWGGFIDRFADFDPLFFNISPLEAFSIDPQERQFIECCWELLEDAGYTRKELSTGFNRRVGVFVGITKTGFNLYGPELWKQGAQVFPHTSFSSVANRISYFLNLQGPSMPIDTMCSSSLTAVHKACESIYQGQCEMAIAGGVNLYLHPSNYIGLSAQQLLSDKNFSTAFGKGGDGFVPGEGVGCVLLKPLSRAVQDKDHIYAVIKGNNINHSGKSNGYMVPDLNAQCSLILENFIKSGVNPRTISYVESAANGSDMGDAIEFNALTRVFVKQTRDTQFCALGSVKPNIGHLEAASGISQLTKVVLQLQYKQLVPMITGESLNPNINIKEGPFYLQNTLREWKRPRITINGKQHEIPLRATVSSFGAGGSNAHLIVEEYVLPQRERVPEYTTKSPLIFIFSAKNNERLENVVRNMHEYLKNHEVASLGNLAYTLQRGREEMDYRLAIVADSRDALIREMQAYLNCITKGKELDTLGAVFSGEREKVPSKISRLFSGSLGESMLQNLIKENSLDEIAIYWTQGGKVQWEHFYDMTRVQRLSLPTYPFDRKKYWITGEREPQNSPDEQNTCEAAHRANHPVTGDLPAIIKQRISGLLGIPTEELPVDDSVNRLGFNSVKAVTLRYMLEQDLGIEIPLTLVSEYRTITQLCTDLQVILDASGSGSRENGMDLDREDAAGEIIPRIVPDRESLYEPFPLNDIQESFFTGRKLRFGGDWVGCHIYFEITDRDRDVYRLKKTWEYLIARHDMLHTVILPDGRQQILNEIPPYQCKVVDLRRLSDDMRKQRLEQIRRDMSHTVYQPGQWPLFDICICLCPEKEVIIHFSVDEFILDAGGINMLLHQWQALYEDPAMQLPEISVSFRDYVLAIKKFESSKRFVRDMAYWVEKLENMPGGPVFAPAQGVVDVSDSARYYRTRLEETFDEKIWSALKQKADALNVSTTALLLSVFSEVLRMWSDRETFSLNLTFFNRRPLHPDLDHILGPFISTNIFVVEGKKGRTPEAIIKSNQERLLNDLNHSSVSGINVLRELKTKGKIPASLILPIVFTSVLNNFDTQKDNGGESLFEKVSYMVTQTPQVFLDHQLYELNGRLKVSWDVAEGYFGADMIRAMFADYCMILTVLAAESGEWTAEMFTAEYTGTHAEKKEPVCASVSTGTLLPEGLELTFAGEDRYNPFPLTDQQQAYAFGRSKYVAGGNIGCQLYQEIEVADLDVARLEKVWNMLIKTHPMLRTMICNDGTQKVLEAAPEFSIPVVDLTGNNHAQSEKALHLIKQQMVDHVFPLDAWPYFDVRVTVLDEKKSRLHISLDLLIADGNSYQLLLKQLYQYYEHPEEALKVVKLSFRDYIMSLQKFSKAAAYKNMIAYWENKFKDLPAGPQLPMENENTDGIPFERLQFKGTLTQWSVLKEHAHELAVSPSMVLLSAYCEVLSEWLHHEPFSIVVPCWERLPLHPQIYEVMGDFTAMSWVVDHGNREAISFADKVRQNHAVVREDLAHMAVSGLKVLRKTLMKGRGKKMLSFPVVFSTFSTIGSNEAPQGFTPIELETKTPQVYLDNINEEHNGVLVYYWDMVKGVYPEQMMKDIFNGYNRLLEFLAASPDNWEKRGFAEIIDGKPQNYTKAGKKSQTLSLTR